MARRFPSFPVRLAAIALLASAWRIYDRRVRGRTPGPESLEDPEISRGFMAVSRLPQFTWLRGYVTRQALQLCDRGLAVDLGCGPGDQVIQLAQQAPGLRVTGVDLSPEMLALAGENARQKGLGERVNFRAGDAACIPFEDHSVDLVVSTLSLHHWSDPKAVFAEVNRVLKPGGAYYNLDLRRDLAAPFYLLIWFATQVVVPAALHHINEPMNSRNAAYTPAEVLELANASPLAGAEVRTGPLWLVLQGHKR